jgi:hypothetical protein
MLGVLLIVAVALRVVLMLVYQPTVLTLADSGDYVYVAQNELFSDPTRSVGYPLLLRGLHAISAQVELVIVLQHIFGVLTGVLLYATIRRIGAPVWVAAIGAAAVLLSLDQIFLEHALMPETAFTFAVVAALYASVRALDDPRKLVGPLTTRAAWLLAAGAAAGLSAWLRPVTVPLLLFLALWLFFALPGGWRDRLGAAALSATAAAAILLGYFALNATHTGYFGVTQASGWALYSRVAPFADCSQFDPPEGTRELCETTPESLRPGPDYYGWVEQSPARRLFGAPPAGDDELSAFGRAAIANQPFAYAEDILRDTARYFVNIQAPPYAGVGYELVDVERRAPGFEGSILASINAYYSDDTPSLGGGIDTLGTLQDVLSVRRIPLLVALALAVLGGVFARGRVRAGIVLLVGTSLLVLLVPVAIAIYSARYAIPVSGPLVSAGALGAWSIVTRLKRWRGG